MPSASSCSAARTTSSTLRLWPRCTTSTPCPWISRRMMLIAASWPSNRLAAVTKRSGWALAVSRPVSVSEMLLAGVLMAHSTAENGNPSIVARGDFAPLARLSWGPRLPVGMIPVYSDPYGHDPRVDRIATLRSAAADDAPSPLFELAEALLAEGKVEESLLLHARSALAGHDGAQVEYGRMLLFGIGCEPDPQLALGWLAQAESQHHPVASYWLAWVAMGSVLLPRDERMNQRLRVAVNHDYPPALRAAALHYGRRPGEADQKACIHLLERAARRGDLVAALLLAERLQRGEGCTAQPQAAATWRAWLRERQVEPLPPTVAPGPRFDGALLRHREPAPLALEDALDTPPVRLLSSEPRVAQVDAVLSSDECRLLIAMAMLNDPTRGAVVPTLRIDPAQEDLALRVLQLRLARSAQAELAHAEAIEVERRIPGSPDWRH